MDFLIRIILLAIGGAVLLAIGSRSKDKRLAIRIVGGIASGIGCATLLVIASGIGAAAATAIGVENIDASAIINVSVIIGVIGGAIGAIRNAIQEAITGAVVGAAAGTIGAVIATAIGVENVDAGVIAVAAGFIGAILGKARRAIPPSQLNVSTHNYKTLPKLEAPAGYVYVIQDVSHTRQYKIGRTNHPATRLNQFGVQLPFETEVVAILRTTDASALEQELHQHYAAQRTRGEWFELTDADIQEIRSI